jgi:hypothetical protein
VTSDITAEAAREVVAAWVAREAAADPTFRGAFLTGSVTALPGGAPLPRTSDVDVTVVVGAPPRPSSARRGPPASGAAARADRDVAAGRRKGKRLVDGLIVDVSYLDEAMLADPARVAASFVYAPSFRGGQVLADPTGQLARLEAVIAPDFASPAAIRARTADVHHRIRARLTALDPRATWPDLVLTWLFPTSLPAVAALVAALRTPTVRLRYLRAREVVPAAEYERLLALLGCADVAPRLVEGHFDAVETWFDETAALLAHTDHVASAASAGADTPAGPAEAAAPARPGEAAAPAGAAAPIGAAAPAGVPDDPPLPYAADLTPAARPVAIDGSRALLDSGDHREAVFWIVATAARCQVALTARAAAVAEERTPEFRALVADLTGLRTLADVLTRRDALLAALTGTAKG